MSAPARRFVQSAGLGCAVVLISYLLLRSTTNGDSDSALTIAFLCGTFATVVCGTWLDHRLVPRRSYPLGAGLFLAVLLLILGAASVGAILAVAPYVVLAAVATRWSGARLALSTAILVALTLTGLVASMLSSTGGLAFLWIVPLQVAILVPFILTMPVR